MNSSISHRRSFVDTLDVVAGPNAEVRTEQLEANLAGVEDRKLACGSDRAAEAEAAVAVIRRGGVKRNGDACRARAEVVVSLRGVSAIGRVLEPQFDGNQGSIFGDDFEWKKLMGKSRP
jgi:hypothetical protein